MKQDLITQRRQVVGLKSSFGCARTLWRRMFRQLVVIAPFWHFAASIAVQTKGLELANIAIANRVTYQDAISDKPKPRLPYSYTPL
jgi:hypothetical protein